MRSQTLAASPAALMILMKSSKSKGPSFAELDTTFRPKFFRQRGLAQDGAAQTGAGK
jgi:hypothetical protein